MPTLTSSLTHPLTSRLAPLSNPLTPHHLLYYEVTSSSDLSLLQSITGIKTWIQNNPGRFTYPAPSNPLLAPFYDYTGR